MFPTPRISIPCPSDHSAPRRVGIFNPIARQIASINTPAAQNRKHTSSNGGNDSSATRIPKYVVPQKKDTDAKASHARKGGEEPKAQGSIRPFFAPPVPSLQLKGLIVTVTINPAIDRIISVDRLAFEDRGYILSRGEAAGGRGLNSSIVVNSFGAPTLAIVPTGGSSGRRFEEDLKRLGFPYVAVPIKQAIRSNFIITDKHGLTVKLNEPGPHISSRELKRFEEAVEAALPKAKWLLLCGSLPPGVKVDFYCHLIRRAKAHKVHTYVDTDGEFLQAILEEQPTVVAPNQQEAEALLNKSLITRQQFREAVERIQRMGATYGLLSLGSRGALITDGKSIYEITPPMVDAVCPIGAGDALDAAFAWAMMQKDDFADAARWGVAAGTASATLPGISFATLEQTRAVYNKVEVKPLL